MALGIGSLTGSPSAAASSLTGAPSTNASLANTLLGGSATTTPNSAGQNLTGSGLGIRSFALSGLASGIDTTSIINQLVAIDSIPLTQLQTTEAGENAKLTLYQTLNSDVAAVQTAVQGLSDPTLFANKAATSSDPTTVSVGGTVDNTATPGDYQVVVSQVGKASQIGSSATVSNLDSTQTLDKAGFRTALQWQTRTVGTQTGPGGQFTVNGVSIDYWQSDTLQNVIDRINQSSAGVTASYDSTHDKMVLTSNTSGGTVTVQDNVGNLMAASGFTNGQTGTGSISSLGLIAKTVTSDLQVGSAFSSPVTDGVLSVNGAAIAVKATDTIQDVLTKINNSAAGVTATFSSATNTLTIKNNSLGSNQITFGSDSSGFLKAAHLDNATTQLGTYTEVTVNGTAFQRTSNTITDVIPGVALTVNKASATDSNGAPIPLDVTVSQNTQSIQDALQKFVDSYNTLAAFYEQNTQGPTYNGTTQTAPAGPLLGDNALSDVMYSLKDTITNQVAGLPTGMNSLADLGITLGSISDPTADQNKITFDPTVLQQALQNNPDGVQKMFTQATTGLSAMLTGTLNSLVGSPGAIMDSTIAYENQQIQNTQDQITNMQAYINQRRQDYITQYTNMEQAMQTIQSQGNSLLTTLGYQMGNSSNSSSSNNSSSTSS